MEFLVAAYTDTGLRKDTNQDSICLRRAMIPGVGEILLAIVCDGMGGLKKGEVASAAAVTALGQWFDKNMQNFPAICGTDFTIVRRQWSDLLNTLHQNLLSYAEHSQINLGTTVSAFFTYGDRYLTATIGDSRIYERKQKLTQLTQDQSLVAREIASGRITEEQSRHHPQRNILLQCLGAGETAVPAYTEGKLKNNALYLICSDGLIHELSPTELEDHLQVIFLNSKDAMTGVLIELTELCKQRGEADNITSILVRVVESDPAPEVSGLKKLANKLHNLTKPRKDIPLNVTLIETAQIIHTNERIGQS